MRFLFAAGVIVMFVLAVIIAADLSVMLPRPKPEIPPPVATPATAPVIILSPTMRARPQNHTVIVLQQAETLKQLEIELKEQRAQQTRIDEKLDRFLTQEEAKDVGGQ